MTSKDPSVAKLFQILHSFTHQATSNTSNDLELIDDVSPLISVLQSSIKLEKQNEVLDCLGNIVADKDKEIEKICEQNYQEFIQSVDQLLLVKQSINSLRNNVTDLNRQIQSGGTQLLLTKMELIQQRKVQKNVDTAIETLKGCLNILKLANKVNLLLQSNKYYLALMTLEDLEQNHLPQTSQYEFTIYMSECIPHMRNSIKKAVVLDKREWLSSLRERSRIIGKKKLNQMMKNFKRWGDKNKEGNSIAFHMVLDEDNESEGEEDDFEQIDQVIKFEPLFQCLHIHKILGILNEFQNSFCEDRQNHGISIISSDIKLESDHISNFDLFIYDITGFFLVEYCIMTTTDGFRMKSDVDILWDQMTSKLLNVISTNLSEANKDNTLHHVKDSLISMALLLEGYNYDIRQLKDYHSSLEFF